ncbi:MAG TPA: hypothetical protein VGH14_18625 [Solirubrobacterales bacterium]|jgi:hypothetical protein
MDRLRRLLIPTFVSCALVTALAFAATASAEVRAGEATSPANDAIPGKGDILATTAKYDSSTGGVTVSLTTREAPGEKQELTMAAVLGRPTEGVCNLNPTQVQLDALPLMQIAAQAAPVGPTPSVESPPSWIEIGEDQTIDGLGLAKKSVTGATTTLSALSPELANKPFTCATVVVQTALEIPVNPKEEMKVPETLDEVSFLLNTLPEPPPAPKPTPPAPAALSFAKSKPVTAKIGKWTKVKVKVANSGGTSVGPIAFKAKAPTGVIVKPGSPKLPALLGGQTWTVNLQVKVTEKAKAKSWITLTGTADSLTATGSVVVKSAG